MLVLDERLPTAPTSMFRGFLLELMEARNSSCSTVFCTQFCQKDWHARFGGGVHADAIMDRIVHGAAWVVMGEFNMRRKLGAEKWRNDGPSGIGWRKPAVSSRDAAGIQSRQCQILEPANTQTGQGQECLSGLRALEHALREDHPVDTETGKIASLTQALNETAIERGARYDGYYCIITSEVDMRDGAIIDTCWGL